MLPRQPTESDEHTPYDARAFFETRTLVGASFSADETRILMSTDARGVLNVAAMPVAGGEPELLTRSTSDNLRALSFFPADDRVLYVADQGGDERDRLYILSETGVAEALTPGDGVRAIFVGWSGDGRSFFVTTNARDRRAFDLYRHDVATGEQRQIFINEQAGEIEAVDPSGRYLALTIRRDNRNIDLYLADLAAAPPELRLLSPESAPARSRAFMFSHDSAKLYYGTDLHSEFVEAWSYELASGARVLEFQARWDVVDLRISATGRFRVVSVNVDGSTEITIDDTRERATVDLAGLPKGDISGIALGRSERMMAFFLENERNPPDLYVVDLETGIHRRLTNNLNPVLDPAELVAAELVRFGSCDGKVELPANLYRPRAATAGRRAPAMLWIHGGPGKQSRLGYDPLFQYLVNHGYAILAVNNRGSSGYGKTFHHLDDRRHGEADVDDCVAAEAYLRGLDWIDGDAIGIMGASYGGFVVLAALAFSSETFAVGVDIFGVVDWVRMLESIPSWWESYRGTLYSELGDPVADRERLERSSPLLHAGQIRRPLLVLQGARDPRVLKTESDALVSALREHGVPVEYVVFDDEGHGFRKRANRIAAAEAILGFLDHHLRSCTCDGSPTAPGR